MGTADSKTFYSYGDTGSLEGSPVQMINVTRALNPGTLAICEMKLFYGELNKYENCIPFIIQKEFFDRIECNTY